MRTGLPSYYKRWLNMRIRKRYNRRIKFAVLRWKWLGEIYCAALKARMNPD